MSYLNPGLPKPVPAPDGLDAPFWAAAAEGILKLQRCNACSRWQWGPEWICHRCLSDDLAFEAIEPRGRIYSYERVWHPVHPALKDQGPYLIVLVEFPGHDGVRMIGNLLGDPHREVSIGTPVRAVFEHHADDDPPYTLVQWTTDATSPSRLDRVSFWFDSLDRVPEPEAPGELPAKTDVLIVGGGFTGLWTAYYLKYLQPDLDITVLEAVTVGFGASGRNGGWCMGTAAGVSDLLDDPNRREAGGRVLRAMMATVDEVGRVCQAENIDCHYAKGGTLVVAHAPFTATRLQRQADAYAERGFADYCHWLPPEESRRRINCTRNHGAVYTPHCAAVHPARLVRGLGEAVRRRGVRVVESTPVLDIRGRTATTARGTVTADAVIRATEGYTDSLAGHKRRLVPLYSMMIATEPLPEAVWEEIGLRRRETFDDGRRVTIYGQRTADGRLAFGGREGYLFGSKRKPFITPDEARFTELEATLKDLFPVLEGHDITHRWGGLMGVPVEWRPYAYFDRSTGFGAAGGYVGEGVGASNLAGRIMADLILERDTGIAGLPWVEDRPERWPPEPLRWLGATALTLFGNRADKVELTTGKRSAFWGRLFEFAASRVF